MSVPREIPYSDGRRRNLEDLHGLKQRARDLRQRIKEFLHDFGGDLVPELRQLNDELTQIEEHLSTLGDHAANEDARE